MVNNRASVISEKLETNMADEAWKNEYALSDVDDYNIERHGLMLHHVHPIVKGGRAHCQPRVRLLMDDVRSELPPDIPYCSRCLRLQSRWDAVDGQNQ